MPDLWGMLGLQGLKVEAGPAWFSVLREEEPRHAYGGLGLLSPLPHLACRTNCRGISHWRV